MFSSTYTPILSPELIAQFLPNLKVGENFHFTSRETDDYNCAAWAIERSDEWIQFYDNNKALIDININRYIEYYQNKGFEVTGSDSSLELNFDKIVIYADGDNFTHVARQLENGHWASKLGEWEDIEHHTLDALSGKFYGYPKIFMKRKKIIV